MPKGLVDVLAGLEQDAFAADAGILMYYFTSSDADEEGLLFFDANLDGVMDGGIRRGTDVYKALALGASAVGIGRPQVEASFVPGVLDAMVKVPDRWSLAAMAMPV